MEKERHGARKAPEPFVARPLRLDEPPRFLLGPREPLPADLVVRLERQRPAIEGAGVVPPALLAGHESEERPRVVVARKERDRLLEARARRDGLAARPPPRTPRCTRRARNEGPSRPSRRRAARRRGRPRSARRWHPRTSRGATQRSGGPEAARERGERRDEAGRRREESRRGEIGETVAVDRPDGEEDVRRREDRPEEERDSEGNEGVPSQRRQARRREAEDGGEAGARARVGERRDEVEGVGRVVGRRARAERTSSRRTEGEARDHSRPGGDAAAARAGCRARRTPPSSRRALPWRRAGRRRAPGCGTSRPASASAFLRSLEPSGSSTSRRRSSPRTTTPGRTTAFSFVKTARRNATRAPAYGHAPRRGPSVARRKRSAARKTSDATRSSARPTIPVTASTWIGTTAKSAAAASEGPRGHAEREKPRGEEERRPDVQGDVHDVERQRVRPRRPALERRT